MDLSTDRRSAPWPRCHMFSLPSICLHFHGAHRNLFKTSSLGCPYPVFILTWHLVAVVPAAINVILFKDSTKDPDDIDDVEVDHAGSFTPTPQTSDPDTDNRSFQKSATQGLQATHSTSDNSIQRKAVPGGADAYR